MPPRSGADDAVTREAIAWYVRLKDASATEADRRAFRRWMNADAERARAYDEVTSLWNRLGPAAAELGAGGWYRPRRVIGIRGLAAAAALAALVLGALWWRDPGLLDRARADHATAPGQRREIALADGTRAYLDGDSAITVSMAAGARDVRLLRGRVWLAVRPSQPAGFRVIAGPVETRVLGTAFAVERRTDTVAITVERGRVAVTAAGLASALVLTAGTRAQLQPGASPAVQRVDPDLAVAWRRGLVVFDRAPLNTVIEELDRTMPGRVVVTDEALRRLLLTGVFRADDPEAILGALRSTLGVQTTRIPGFATLVHR